MKKLLSILAAFSLFLSFSYAWASSQPIGGQTYYLAGAGVTSTQNTIQLSSMKTPDGRNVTMTMIGTVGYGALEPQTNSKIEDVTFTGITQNANGTATLTGVSRGMDFVYPYTSSASLEKSHAGGATFIITNTAGFYYNEFAMQNNANVNTWPFASTSPATKGYVDYVAFNGAAVINADTGNRGVVQIATGLQVASSTATGSTGATVVIPASAATSTYNTLTAPLKVVVTQNSGKVDENFLPSTLANNYTFNGNLTLNGTVTGSVASTTLKFYNATSTTSTWTKPSGLKYVIIRLVAGGGGSGGLSGANPNYYSTPGGGAGGSCYRLVPAAALGSTETVTVGAGGLSGTSAPGNGGDGGSTSFGSWAVATGGTHGAAVSAAAGVVDGGIGGTCTTGDIKLAGGQGFPGVSTGSTAAAGYGMGGVSSFGGTQVGGTESAPGVNQSYGNGAAGHTQTSTPGTVGTIGASGAVFVEEHY